MYRPTNTNQCVLHDDFVEQVVSAVKSSVSTLNRLWIFGSYARGDARADSDIDLFFTYSGGAADRLENSLSARRALRPLMRKFERDFDVVCMDDAAFRSSVDLQEGLLPNIVAEEGVLVYG